MDTKKAWIVFLLLLYSPVLFAQEYEEHYLNITIPSVGELIEVSTPLNVSSLIPYQEYASVINIEWGIPESAMKDISVDEILIFVSISSKNETEYLYFKDGNSLLKETTAVLRCKIIDGKCGNGSELMKEIPFRIKINRLGIDFENVVIIRANLVSSSEVPALINETLILNETITEMKERIESLNVSDTEKNDFISSVKEAERKLEVFDVNRTAEDIAGLNETLSMLTKKSELLTSISMMETEIRNKINLTNEESDIAIDIASLLADAKNATISVDFGKAGLVLNLAKNKLGLLNEMINDRIGTIPFLRKNLFYISSLILAFVALLLSFIIKLRLNERIAIAVFSIFLIAIGMLNLESMFGEGMYIAFTIIEILIMLLLVYIHIKRKREMQKKKRY